MRHLLLLVVFVPVFGIGQSTGQVWSEIGMKGEFTKKLDWSVEVNTRFGNSIGVESFFPQVGLKYKVAKWFRPSIQYRYIFDLDRYGNYAPANRFMLNASFEKDFNKRLSGEVRIRYQNEFSHWTSNSGYEQSMKQIVRLKPEIVYDIKKSTFKPYINSELFYTLEPYRPHFSKLRIGVGTDFEIDDPLSIGVGYIYDKELNNTKGLPSIRHIFTTSIKYKF